VPSGKKYSSLTLFAMTHLNQREVVMNMRVYSLFTVDVSENVLCQEMVGLLNPVCVLLSEMLHVCKSKVHVTVFRMCSSF